MVIGVANVGGMIEEDWIPALLEALEAGLDIISGMHTRLASNPELKAAAERLGFADRMFTPDFRDRMVMIARPPARD